MYLNICITTVDKILEKVIFEPSAAAADSLRSLAYNWWYSLRFGTHSLYSQYCSILDISRMQFF